MRFLQRLRMYAQRNVFPFRRVVPGIGAYRVMGFFPSGNRKLEELTLMTERPLLPGRHQNIQYLGEHALGEGVVGTMPVELNIGAPARATHDPAIEASRAGDIEHREIFSETQRMPVRQRHPSGTHA